MKRRLKIALDILMLLTTVTLFSKNLISMKYHEVAGLILIAAVIVHIALNIKTITAMCRNFIKVPAAVKAGLIVDIFLILCFALLGISGILISHTILTGISSDNVFFKLSHMFAGGLSVILLGVHIGLHICRKPMPVLVSVIISAIVFCGGIYGAAKSNEIRWLSMPFTAPTHQSSGMGKGMDIGMENGNPEHRSNNGGEHQNSKPQGVQNAQHGNPVGGNRRQLSVFQKLQSIAMFAGMILSCTMITYWVSVPKKKKAKQ